MNFDNYVNKLSDAVVKSTQEVVRIPSVEKEGLPGKPFGEDVNAALEYMLALGQSMGFATKNVDGYAGYVEFGEGEEMVGILAHLDVVPEGKDWTYPPYGGEIHDGKIYGRGSIDDKGPTVAALYAMKAVKDSGIQLGKRVRLILGLNEESGSKCMEYYKKKEEIPSCSFTPDSDYPVIHAEKGIANYSLSTPTDNSKSVLRITSIKGGHRVNMVPDFCEAVIEVQDEHTDNVAKNLKQIIENKKFNIELSVNSNIITLQSHGISAHGSTPADGINAISCLILVLGECLKNFNITNKFITFYNQCIGLETDGRSIGCAVEDEVSGKLTLNAGIIDYNSSSAELKIDIRYPVTFTEDNISKRIQAQITEFAVSCKIIGGAKPLYLPKDHPLVQTLMNVYREATGDNRDPVSIGGGTYARSMPNAVAFGAAFPEEPPLAHQKDEYIAIDSLIKNTEIFARAIYELAR